MSLEPGHIDQFNEIIQSEDVLKIREYLNSQNISDVAELIYEFPEFESQIIGNLSIHRASSTFKILDVPTQKRIIQELSPSRRNRTRRARRTTKTMADKFSVTDSEVRSKKVLSIDLPPEESR